MKPSNALRWIEAVLLICVSRCLGLPADDESDNADIQRLETERAVLITFYHAVLANQTNRLALADEGLWLSDQPVCKWVGISCGALPSKALLHASTDTDGGGELKVLEPSTERPPDNAVTAIQLPSLGLEGTIPTVLGQLQHLLKLRLDHNQLKSTLPTELARATSLRYLDLSRNELEGTIPESYATQLSDLQLFSVQKNFLSGSIPPFDGWTSSMQKLDFSFNSLQGSIPSQIVECTSLRTLALDNNILTGRLPDWGQMKRIKDLDVSSNALSGSIPSSLKNCRYLQEFVAGDNALGGTIPPELFEMTNLRALVLSDNQLTGSLDFSRASNASNLGVLAVSNNQIGSTIPSHIGLLTNLNVFLASGNKLIGRVPDDLALLKQSLWLNLTDNLLTGDVPSVFCNQSRDHGCAAFLCPAGTWHPHGHATDFSCCHQCPNIPFGQESVLGRNFCYGHTKILHGDIDCDGVVSQREVLRLLFVNTIGRLWGQAFQNWYDMDGNECDLEGVVCIKGGIIAKIDVSNADLCSLVERKSGYREECLGIPTEMGLLSDLEILQLSRQTYLQGTIPTEIGTISRLRHIDVSSTLIAGTIPTEVGLLTNLLHFLASFCHLEGSIPTELFLLHRLEKLHLTDNELTGTLPENIELSSLRELMISRNEISGSLSSQVGRMAKLENFEVYSNKLTGSLPPGLAFCSNLKRIDFFNNQITGSIPLELSLLKNLQIFHAKQNLMTGTIPPEIGALKEMSWFDASQNFLHGTIPDTFGDSQTIRDFRVGDNMLHDPVPVSLCNKEELNDGATVAHGCDGVVCSLGTFSETGFATESGCLPCPKGQSTVYLGSTGCRTFDEKDILTMIYAVMEGIPWPAGYDETWNKDNSDDVCEWQGVECDENGEIESLTIPVPYDDVS